MDYRLPLPPSSNDLVRPAVIGFVKGKPQIRLVSTGEAKAFRKTAHALLPIAPVGGALEVFITVYVPTLSSDGGNRLKALEDACNGRLWFDDKQIAEWHIVKVVTGDPEFTGVNLRVEPANPLEHPELCKRLAKSTIATQEAELAQSKLNLPLPSNVDESLAARFKRLAKPAVYRPDPQPPGAA